MPKILVIAGEYREFIWYCRENGLVHKSDCSYVYSRDHLRGRIDSECDIRCVGRYWLNEAFEMVRIDADGKWHLRW